MIIAWQSPAIRPYRNVNKIQKATTCVTYPILSETYVAEEVVFKGFSIKISYRWFLLFCICMSNCSPFPMETNFAPKILSITPYEIRYFILVFLVLNDLKQTMLYNLIKYIFNICLSIKFKVCSKFHNLLFVGKTSFDGGVCRLIFLRIQNSYLSTYIFFCLNKRYLSQKFA